MWGERCVGLHEDGFSEGFIIQVWVVCPAALLGTVPNGEYLPLSEVMINCITEYKNNSIKYSC